MKSFCENASRESPKVWLLVLRGPREEGRRAQVFTGTSEFQIEVSWYPSACFTCCYWRGGVSLGHQPLGAASSCHVLFGFSQSAGVSWSSVLGQTAGQKEKHKGLGPQLPALGTGRIQGPSP